MYAQQKISFNRIKRFYVNLFYYYYYYYYLILLLLSHAQSSPVYDKFICMLLEFPLMENGGLYAFLE